MAYAYLTRKLSFSAAHRYDRPEWTEAENRRVFGRCNNPHGHGHNYTLEVRVGGEIDSDTGFCVDLTDLDELLEAHVVDPFDHRHLNHAIDEFGHGRRIPTLENLLAYLWPRLSDGLPDGVTLHRLRLHEDEHLYADYFGGAREVAS